MDRRTLLKSAAWTVPVVTVATAAPAYATSGPPSCTGTGWYKDPGEGQATKDYYVQLDCTNYGPIFAVSIYDDVAGVWLEAENVADNIWVAYGFNDSRRHRSVMINNNHTIVVAFPPMN